MNKEKMLEDIIGKISKNKEKIYPSELNSKSIACRVPMEQYLNFLMESQKLGISLNDLMLLKIFNNELIKNVKPGHSENDNNDNDYLINFIGDINDSDLWGRLNVIHTNVPDENGDHPFSRLLKETDKVLEVQFNSNGHTIHFHSLSEILHFLRRELKKKNSASLENIKTQLSILISNKFDNLKDRKEYSKEIFDLLKELE